MKDIQGGQPFSPAFSYCLPQSIQSCRFFWFLKEDFIKTNYIKKCVQSELELQ